MALTTSDSVRPAMRDPDANTKPAVKGPGYKLRLLCAPCHRRAENKLGVRKVANRLEETLMDERVDTCSVCGYRVDVKQYRDWSEDTLPVPRVLPDPSPYPVPIPWWNP